MTRALRWAALLASIALLSTIAGPQLLAIARRPATTAVDLLPVWCQSRILVYGDAACDPTVISAIFHKPVGPARDTSSAYYYPPTAALLLLPTAALPFELVARGFRWFSALSLLGAAGLVVAAVPVRDRVLGATGGMVLAAGVFSLRVVRGALLAGQTGPVVVGLTAAALWAVGRERHRFGGVVTAVGVALKLFPGLVLLALLRRRAGWPWFVGALAALVVVTFLFPHHAAPFGWLGGAMEFVDRPMRGAWSHEPAWVIALWRGRFVGLGIPTAAAVVFGAWRARSAAAEVALAFLLVAWGGTVMAGSPQTHEGLVVLPAVLWVLAWPLQLGPRLVSALAALAALLLGVVLWELGVMSSMAPPNSLHWVPVGYLAWVGCLVRWGWALREMDPRGVRPQPGSI